MTGEHFLFVHKLFKMSLCSHRYPRHQGQRPCSAECLNAGGGRGRGMLMMMMVMVDSDITAGVKEVRTMDPGLEERRPTRGGTAVCLMLLQVPVLVLVLIVVLGGGQQAGDVANAFGDALPEEQLGAQSQVLGVFDEAEANHGALAGTQLVLRQRKS